MTFKNARVLAVSMVDWFEVPKLLSLFRPNTHGVTYYFFCGPGSVSGAFVCGVGFGQCF